MSANPNYYLRLSDASFGSQITSHSPFKCDTFGGGVANMDRATQSSAFPQSAGGIQKSFRTLPVFHRPFDPVYQPGNFRVTKPSRGPKNNRLPFTSSRAMASEGWWNCNPANDLHTVLPSTPSANSHPEVPLSQGKRDPEYYHLTTFKQLYSHGQQQAQVRPHESRTAPSSSAYTQGHGNPLTVLADVAVEQVNDESLSGGGYSRENLVDLTQAGRQRLRNAVACEQCRKRKIKCVPNETDICTTCLTKKRECKGYSRVDSVSLVELREMLEAARASATASQFNPATPAAQLSTQLSLSYSGHIPGYSDPHDYSYGRSSQY